MIENEFDCAQVAATNFGVKLKSNGNLHFVPTDNQIKNALEEILITTVASFDGIGGAWEAYDLSEDYGARRKIHAPLNDEYMAEVALIFNSGALMDMANVDQHIQDLDVYFAEFTDNQGRKCFGIKKATRLKGTAKARNRLVRLVDDTLEMIPDNVLRLDEEFDILVTSNNVFILNAAMLERIANIVNHVAATAATKVQLIHDTVTFLDLSRIKADISRHPRIARQAAAVAANPKLASLKQDRVQEAAEKHGIKFKALADGRLQCRVSDHARLMEILDARRYHLDLADDGGDLYRASGRQKVSAA